VGRTVRNGLNFTERGFGVRAAVGCSDRGHTAVSQLKPGDVDGNLSLHNRARDGSTPAGFSVRYQRRPRSLQRKRCKQPADPALSFPTI
jgi:hypothetical protein